jgi:hypothetical protein
MGKYIYGKWSSKNIQYPAENERVSRAQKKVLLLNGGFCKAASQNGVCIYSSTSVSDNDLLCHDSAIKDEILKDLL